MPAAQRFFLFVAISALLWIGFVPIYHAAFAWTEFVPGANWVYLPHGLRMMLVLLFGLAGALGFTLGASLLAMTILSSTLLPPAGVPAVVDISLALVPGLAPVVGDLRPIRYIDCGWRWRLRSNEFQR